MVTWRNAVAAMWRKGKYGIGHNRVAVA